MAEDTLQTIKKKATGLKKIHATMVLTLPKSFYSMRANSMSQVNLNSSNKVGKQKNYVDTNNKWNNIHPC